MRSLIASQPLREGDIIVIDGGFSLAQHVRMSLHSSSAPLTLPLSPCGGEGIVWLTPSPRRWRGFGVRGRRLTHAANVPCFVFPRCLSFSLPA